MIPKPLDQITKEDVDLLVKDRADEKLTLEFKRDLNVGNDEEKQEFLADVSSFANAQGGDLVFGVAEEDGKAVEVVGLKDTNPDQAKQKLENMLRDSVDPRITGLEMKSIDIPSDGFLLIVRVPRSDVAPHAVMKGQSRRHYTRNSNGKCPMDTNQIRAAYTGSQSLAERMQGFRSERIQRFIAGDTPVPVVNKVRLIMHLLPVEGFTGTVDIPPRQMCLLHDEHGPFKSLGRLYGTNGPAYLVNPDGLLTLHGFDPQVGYDGYCQIFRSGSIETFGTGFTGELDGKMLVRSVYVEEIVLHSLADYRWGLEQLGVKPPFMLGLALVGIIGVGMATRGRRYDPPYPHPALKDVEILPHVMIGPDDQHLDVAVRPAFDALWNVFGLEESQNYGEDGRWRRGT